MYAPHFIYNVYIVPLPSTFPVGLYISFIYLHEAGLFSHFTHTSVSGRVHICSTLSICVFLTARAPLGRPLRLLHGSLSAPRPRPLPRVQAPPAARRGARRPGPQGRGRHAGLSSRPGLGPPSPPTVQLSNGNSQQAQSPSRVNELKLCLFLVSTAEFL